MALACIPLCFMLFAFCYADLLLAYDSGQATLVAKRLANEWQNRPFRPPRKPAQAFGRCIWSKLHRGRQDLLQAVGC